MKLSKKPTLWIAALSGALALSVSAGPADPKLIASNAEWMVHLNQEAVRKSSIGQAFYKQTLAPYIAGLDKPHLDLYLGLLWNNLQSLTIYGDDYGRGAEKTTILIVTVTQDFFNQAKLMLENDQHYTPEKQQGSLLLVSNGSVPEHAIAFQGTNHILIARTRAATEGALAVLAGEKKCLSGDSNLTTFAGKASNDSILRIGAHKFNQDPDLRQAALLSRLTQRIGVEIGEPGYELAINITLDADSPETAKNMRQTIDGMAALMALSQDGKRGLGNLSQYFGSEQAASQVLIKATIPTDEVQEALSNVRLEKLCGGLLP